MSNKRIMVCLDGSKNSLRGLDAAISSAKQSDATIIGVHSDTSFSAFSAVRAPMGFPKELFFGSTSNFVLHKAKSPVTIVK